MKIGIIAFLIFVSCFTLCLFSIPALAMSGNGTAIDPYIVTNISEFQDIDLYAGANISDNTGTVDFSPEYLIPGINSIEVTGLGNLTIWLPIGQTGLVESDTCTVNSSPVSISPGFSVITVENSVGYITITLSQIYFELGNDINASVTSGWNTGSGFIPIGNSNPLAFTGHLDGKGYTVDKLYENISQLGCIFNALYSSETVVENIHFTNINITSDSETSGFCYVNLGTISNISVSGTVTTNCPTNIGGAFGFCQLNYNNISKCSTSVVVYAVSVVDSISAGFCGTNIGNIFDSYSTGTVNSSMRVAGFCLANLGLIERCYSIGYVPSLLGGGSGGFCHANGGTITSCYWDTDTSGILVSDGGTGKTTAEMMQQATFIGWNFSVGGIWSITEGVTYPFLAPMTPIVVSPPTNFVATVISNSQIMLTWLDGSGTSTLARMSTSGYPANTSSGTFLCNGSTQVYNCSNLTLEQNYFFRAWSYNSSLGLFSIPVDTSSIIHSGIRAAIPYPVSNFTVPGWYGDPGIPNIPLRDLFIDSASHIGCSPMVLISAVAIALAIAISVGIFLFSGSVMFGAFFGLIILIGGYWSAGMPVWIMLTYCIVAVSLYFVLRRA
jgi:hypothetical protein